MGDVTSDLAVRYARPSDLAPGTLYGILKLRADVFIVEQNCAYPDLDGRDIEPHTWHLWIDSGGAVVATLRVVDEADAQRIGRVVTHPDHRGNGLAGRLMRHTLGLCGEQPIDVHAQCHLEGWYAGFGFARTGPDFDEDGIRHVPMRRPAGASA